MNLPSPDEQLDLHGPRAQLPFEQIPPQSRAGVKSSHESQKQDKALIVANCIITSGGTPDSSSPNQEILVSPGSASAPPTGDGQKRPDGATESISISDSVTVTNKKECPQTLSGSFSPCPPTINRDEASLFSRELQQQAMVNMDASEACGRNEQQKDEAHVADQPSTSFLSRLFQPWRAKLNRGHHAQSSATTMHSNVRPRLNAYDFGPIDAGGGEDSNGIPPARATRFQNFAAMFKRFMGFVGPGYIVSVGYMDPGNWATDLAGGSSFGYMLLFVILCSNLMAVVLQGLAVKLGVVTGLDLAQACRKFTPKYVNWVLYVLAELAIIACDLAEVIGSAVALNLLFNIPLPWGVVITGADVLIILIAFRDDQSVKSRRLFEALVILLVSAVGVCFTLEIVYSQPVAKDVFRGFLPNAEILTNKEALYLAIGIIGATVMPHNLYLHSSIVKLRTRRELNDLASSQASMSSTSDLMTVDQRQSMQDGDKGAVSMKHSTIRRTLKYTFWDSTVALTFALYVNSAILIVSAATFKYKYPDANNEGLADFFDAFHLLSQYLGKAAGYVFAVALLLAGQSSTLTATLAGQIIMEGFLGTSYLKPWVRRLFTRCLAIIPALAIVIVKGQNGLSELMLASQVALSIQLPFAVVPLVLFTSMGRCMTVSVSDNEDKPGEMEYGMRYEKDSKEIASDSAATTYTDDSNADVNNNRALASNCEDPTNVGPVGGQIAAEARAVAASTPGRPSPQLMHNFANTWWLVIISCFISIVLLSLNFYLLVGAIQGE
ncbi:hypothetical protein BG011_006111 [Mortierella polycephala]|uniref:Natural resistance-associated macrophage protein n=1 Tax=Mortierella polycephala TaxID=41804 RepID=A0A9P6U0I1_9FUNG|nr:hypothetical protein BG011_006111 [Mortierella polycephala]